METGFRPGADGKLVPRDIIRKFHCRYNGEQVVFGAELHPAIRQSVYRFFTVATESGTLEFTWEGDRGFTQTEKMPDGECAMKRALLF
jgi:sulfur-oxidizing protein SoxZ